MFINRPSYKHTRNLTIMPTAEPAEDVFAFQTGLLAMNHNPGALDGVYGPQMLKAVLAFQRGRKIEADGVVGPTSKAKMCEYFEGLTAAKYSLPRSLLKGQVTHESGRNPGAYGPINKNGSWDAGAAQMNSFVYRPERGFTVPVAIDTLGANTAAAFARYVGVEDLRRRYELAAGAWNAPYWANYLAGVKPWATPTPSERATFEAYMASVTAYLVL